MITANIHEAKTSFSTLLKRANEGEEVIIVKGRERVPIARLVPYVPVKKRRIGLLAGRGIGIGPEFWIHFLKTNYACGTERESEDLASAHVGFDTAATKESPECYGNVESASRMHRLAIAQVEDQFPITSLRPSPPSK
jgi:prevent-host-death family protein